MWQVITIMIIVVGLAYLYKRYETKYLYETHDEHTDIRKFFLGKLTRDDIGAIRKPLLWIYVPHEYNGRNWMSFGSRSSYELNQPYLYLTTKSILKHCSTDFHVIIIDDTSFPKLLEHWPYEATPLNQQKRLYGLIQILYTYGGMLTPISFVCFRSLLDLYYTGTRNNKMFVAEKPNHETLVDAAFVPSPYFIGALKQNPVLLEFVGYLKHLIETDYTLGSKVEGKVAGWLQGQISQQKVNLVRGYEVGVMKKDETPVLVDDLLNQSYINMNLDSAYGVWVPSRDILHRTNYQWFARMSEEQVLMSNVMLGKYIVKAVAPSQEGLSPQGVDAPNTLIAESSPSDWVSFWNTPLYKGLYGLQPLYLGQEVPKNKNQDPNYKFTGVIQ